MEIAGWEWYQAGLKPCGRQGFRLANGIIQRPGLEYCPNPPCVTSPLWSLPPHWASALIIGNTGGVAELLWEFCNSISICRNPSSINSCRLTRLL
jgi:hypothetical protein